ncbi:MAG: hypothetical protein ACI934_001014, partial [Pseudohongiellaceae bacterium]
WSYYPIPLILLRLPVENNAAKDINNKINTG